MFILSLRQHRNHYEREQGNEGDGAEDFFCGVGHGVVMFTMLNWHLGC